MRLTAKEIEVIPSVVKSYLGSVEVYLFGSRVDDRKRGGDIDLLVIGEDSINITSILNVTIELKEKLGDQKIDLLYQQRGNLTPFGKLVFMESVQL